MVVLVTVQKMANGQLERESNRKSMLLVVAIEKAGEFDGGHGGSGGQEQ